MNRDEIKRAYDRMAPEQGARERMLENILAQTSARRQSERSIHMSRRLKTAVVLAAILALCAAMALVAAANGWFRLDGLDKVIMDRVETDWGHNFIKQPDGTTKLEPNKIISYVISLQGIKGSPEYEAEKEWFDFTSSYDPEGTLLREADRLGKEGSLDIPGNYSDQGCYTQEMVDKLDEICEEYSLKIPGMLPGICMPCPEQTQMHKEIMQRSTRYEISDELAAEGYGVAYDDGSFDTEGTFNFDLIGGNPDWPHDISYQFGVSVKGSFGRGRLKIGDTANYDQWEYKTEDGTQVLLALSPSKGLIIADMDNCFAVVNVIDHSGVETVTGEILGGNMQYMTREVFQAFADTFDFTGMNSMD